MSRVRTTASCCRRARHSSTGPTLQIRVRSGTRSRRAQPPFWRAQASAGAGESQLRPPVRALLRASPGLVSSRRTWAASPLPVLRPLTGCPGTCRPRSVLSASLSSTPSPGEAIRAIKAARSFRAAKAARSRRATAAGAVVADVTESVAVKSRRVAARKLHGRASSSRSAACSTYGTRATASCVRAGTCRAARTCTSRSRRQGGSRYGVATPSRVHAARRDRARSTPPCCGSTRFAGCRRKRPVSDRVSRT